MLRKIRDNYWSAETRTQVETQFGADAPLVSGDLLTIATGDDAGDYAFDDLSAATVGLGVIQVPGHAGRFILTDNSIRIVADRADAGPTRAFANSAGQLFVMPSAGVYRGI